MTLRRILVAHDLSPNSRPALDEAIRLARKSGAEIVVFHVFPAPIHGDLSERDVLTEILERIVVHARSFHVAARLRVSDGPTATAILAAADAEEAEAILLGTHARTGLRRVMLGSVAEEVVRRSRRPVLVAKARRRPPLDSVRGTRVIVGVDFSPASLEAVGQAAGIARLLAGNLELVHVCHPLHARAMERGRAEERLEAVGSELHARGMSVTPVVSIASNPARAIVAEAEGDPDAVIAVGTNSRIPGAAWFLGSVAREVVRRAPCPVLVTHSPLAGGVWDAAESATP